MKSMMRPGNWFTARGGEWLDCMPLAEIFSMHHDDSTACVELHCLSAKVAVSLYNHRHLIRH